MTAMARRRVGSTGDRGFRKCPGMAGFTLIELMIVVAVIAILAAIAYPSYQGYMRQVYRGQAKADLVEYALLAERFHTVNNTYVGFSLPSDQSPRESGSVKRYTLSLATQTASAFLIEAQPAGTQAQDQCAALSLSQTGLKTSSGGAVADCW